ncbi:BI1-like protein [Tanacetum coccineum]
MPTTVFLLQEVKENEVFQDMQLIQKLRDDQKCMKKVEHSSRSKGTEDIRSFVEVLVLNHYVLVRKILKLFVLMYSLNHMLFAIFTVSLALATGLACSFTHGTCQNEKIGDFCVGQKRFGIFFPLDRISVMIYERLVAIIFCGYIVYDTGNLIKGYTYDEYKWSALELNHSM